MTVSLVQTPGICVLGMHRSGTSLITGTLEELGLHLGPAEHLMVPREDNPDGFFEHQLLTDLNDEILWRFGGSWHEPPALPSDWQHAPSLDGVRARALRLLKQDFGSGRPWAWKDPRTCLTLPFWRELLPSLRFVISVRSPIAVARSLKARDGFSTAKSAALWLRHMHGALADSEGAPRLLVSYDDMVDEPAVERARLTTFVPDGVPGREQPESPIVLMDGRLRHHRSALLEVAADATLPYAVRALYVSLRLLTDLQRGSTPGDDRLQAIALLSDQLDDVANHMDEHVLRDEIVDLRWVMHRAAAENGRLEEMLGARTAELAAARKAVGAIAGECERALELCRAERSRHEEVVSQQAEAVRVEASLRAEIGALEAERAALARHVSQFETPRGVVTLALRLLLPPRIYGGLRDALGPRGR